MRMPLMASACVLLAAAAVSPRVGVGAQDGPRRIAGAEQVQVSLVLIDVVVRDRKDRPVSGLTLDDFELIVDSLPVAREEIETFEETCPASPTTVEGTLAETAGGAPAPVAIAPITSTPRSIVIYLDFSNLSLIGRQLGLRSLRDHLIARIGPSDRVMLLAYKNGLRLVQDFTSDRDLLASRMEDLMAERRAVDTEVAEESANLEQVFAEPPGPARELAAASFAAAEDAKARRSLTALERLMPALATVTGRKALILLTDALRQNPGIQYVTVVGLAVQRPKNIASLAGGPPTPDQVSMGADEATYLTDDLVRVTKEANAAGVAFYTVHASGLDDGSGNSGQESAWRESTSQAGGTEPFAPWNPIDQPQRPKTITATQSRGGLILASRRGLDSALALQTTLAVETGGRALQRTNDVGGILDTAQQDLSCHYVLGYRHPARGDGKRHSVLVRLRPDASGEPWRGLTVQHRPYYTDSSPRDRTERLMRSALDIPDLHRGLPVTAEAFALAPLGMKAHRVLIKASVPLESLSLIPAGESLLEGRITVRGEVFRTDSVDCRFENELTVQVARAGSRAETLVYETGCVLDEGPYELSLAIMDAGTRDVGAMRTPLHVPAVRFDELAYLSEVHLWTRDPSAVLVSAGAAQVGIKEGTLQAGFIPRAERMMPKDQEAMLTFLLCPPDGAAPTADNPIRIRRTLQGEDNKTVADFRDLLISEPPDPQTGCYQILNAIPARTLGEGVYTFTIDLRGAPLGPPLSRQAALEVQ